MKKDFEFLPHTSDLKLRIYGKTLHELFRHALNGMFQSIKPLTSECTNQGDRLVCPTWSAHRTFTLDGSDSGELLVNFLSHALSLSDIYNEAYFDVTIDFLSEEKIRGTLHGISITGFDGVEIKAVTYYGLDLKNIDGEWQVEIVFDI